jgi:Dinucleotide-utilizing enzymes involved in molybdopterin and thiamine biosynthesis family 2
MTTIIPRKTDCLRCIFPDPPPSEIFPVLGGTAGTLGCLQAMEAIKYVVGSGALLTNRLLIFDGFSMKFREVRLERDPQCPDCSPSAGS